MSIELLEVTANNVHAVLALKLGPDQRGLVAPNAYSIAEAHYEPRAWFRAVVADATPVGFVMVYQDTWRHYLWRMMIDAAHQHRGYGAATMHQVIDRARAAPGIDSLWLSYVDRAGNAAPFYRHLGFRETGEVDDGEIVMKLAFD